MPELRIDPPTGALVVVAPERAARPDDFRVSSARTASPNRSRPQRGDEASAGHECPFCAGHEHLTPPEIERRGDGEPGSPGWRVRVVPNKYPVTGGALGGAHEVVVLSPDHDRDLIGLDPGAALEVLSVWRDRARSLRVRHAHTQVFLNAGRAAGASLDHPHAQIVALDFVSPTVAAIVERFTGTGHDLIAESITAARREDTLVREAEFVTWCPAASAFPFEMAIAVPDTGGSFDSADDDTLRALATGLQDALSRLREAVGEAAYNVVVVSPPHDAPAGCRWWVRITPRLAVTAGFEAGTGVLVNVLDPRVAADRLRGAMEAGA